MKGCVLELGSSEITECSEICTKKRGEIGFKNHEHNIWILMLEIQKRALKIKIKIKIHHMCCGDFLLFNNQNQT